MCLFADADTSPPVVSESWDMQDEGGSAEEAGPLAEISFWRERSADLSSLRTQLDSLSKPCPLRTCAEMALPESTRSSCLPDTQRRFVMQLLVIVLFATWTAFNMPEQSIYTCNSLLDQLQRPAASAGMRQDDCSSEGACLALAQGPSVGIECCGTAMHGTKFHCPEAAWEVWVQH